MNLDFMTVKSPFKDNDIESCCIRIPAEWLIKTNVYRPFGDKNIFQEDLYKQIRAMKAEFRGHKHILVGDVNYDLTNLEGITIRNDYK